MCNYPRLSSITPKEYRKLTLLILDCWQREYDGRPYRHFKLDRLKFEERLERNYDPTQDFFTIVLYIENRILCSTKLVGLRVIANDISIMEKFVKGLQNLKQIELKLMEMPTEFFQLLACNTKHMSVEELSLEGTPLNDEDISYLHHFVRESKSLCKLNVASCSLNQYNFALVADAIHKSVLVKTLNMSYLLGKKLTLDSNKVAHTVASLIWQNKLQELDVENCGLIGQDMEIIAEYLYHKCSKLQSLNVSYNKIGANGAVELLKAISSSGTLKHLEMNGCSLATHDGEVMTQYLSSCWSLQSLAIQNNDIEAEPINMILLCMKKCCTFQKFYLFGNFFNKRTGEILKRLFDSKILSQHNVDVAVTFDDTIAGYRVLRWLS